MNVFLRITNRYVAVIFWITLVIDFCCTSASSASLTADEKRNKVCTIRILPLQPEIKGALSWTTPVERLREIQATVTEREKSWKVSTPSEVEPYRQTHGLGTFFEYVSSDVSAVQPLLLMMTEYATRYLKKDDESAARNTLIVRFSFLNEKDEQVFHVIDAGMFVSGTDSYFLRDVKQRIVKAGDLDPSQPTFVSVLGGRRITSPDATSHFGTALATLSRELKDSNTVNPDDKTGIVFSIPVLREVKRMPPIALSSLYDETEKSKWLSQHYEATARFFFSSPEERPSSLGFMSVPAMYKSVLMHSESANLICKILFGKPALNEGAINGCFEDNFELSFTDSEQVLMNLLGKGLNPNLLRVVDVTGLEGKEPDINEACKVRIELLSQKDICPFCRGFMSFLLSQSAEGKSWFEDRFDKFLRGLPVELRGSKEYNATRPLGVEIYASSVIFSTKD